MVRRSSDQPRTVSETIKGQATDLADLARRTGRSAAALSNTVGHSLKLDPRQPSPTLVPGNLDTTLKFTPSGVELRDQAGTGVRTLISGAIDARGTVNATAVTTGTVNTTGVNAGGAGVFNGGVFAPGATISADPGGIVRGLNAVFGATNTGALTVGFAGSTFNGAVAAPGRNISTDPAGSINSLQITCGNLTYGTLTAGSDGRLKVKPDDVDEAAADLEAAADKLLAAPVRSWRWKPRHDHDPQTREQVDVTPDHRTHVGLYAQDAPEPLRVTLPDGTYGLDRATYDGLLLRIVQRQQDTITALTKRVAALERRPTQGPIADGGDSL